MLLRENYIFQYPVKNHTENIHQNEDIEVTDTMDDLDFAMAVFEDDNALCK